MAPRTRLAAEARNLRRLRQRAGLTRQQLAERVRVTLHTIRAWENGERAVRKEWLFKLAAALDCSVADLREAKVLLPSRGGGEHGSN
jgi:transcriptional regulator with XRE-family HTH domain